MLCTYRSLRSVVTKTYFIAFHHLFARLQGIIADLENKLDKQIAENARATVARDLELDALRQQEEKMRLEIVQIREATDRSIIYRTCHEIRRKLNLLYMCNMLGFNMILN